MLIASNFLLWIVAGLLTIAVLAALRELHALRERITRPEEVLPANVVEVGDRAPPLELSALDDTPVAIGAPGAHRAKLLLFPGEFCPAAEAVVDYLRTLAIALEMRSFLVAFGGRAEQQALADLYRLDPAQVIGGPELRALFGLAKLPTAVLIDTDGTLVGRRVIAGIEQIERLLGEGGILHVADADAPSAGRRTG